MKKYNDGKKLRQQEEKQEEELARHKKIAEDWKHLREESKRQSQDLKDIGDKIKRQKENEKKIIDELTRKKDNPDTPKNESFDEQCKREYTEEAERKLKEKNISDAQLSQKLGVSDWKVEMNKSSGWRTAQTLSFSINKAIEKIENEIVCDYCKETKVPYPGTYEIPSKKKKFCSQDCKSTWEKENKEDNKDKKNDDKKKDDDSSSNRKNEFKDFSIGDFFALMKKLGVKEFWYDFENDQVMIKFNDGQKKQLKEVDSGLSEKQQKSLTEQVKSSSKPITFSEVDREYNKKGKDNGGNGNVGIIAAVVVVGLILAVIIGVVIGKNNKKKDY